jgi:hypothetical protein
MIYVFIHVITYIYTVYTLYYMCVGTAVVFHASGHWSTQGCTSLLWSDEIVSVTIVLPLGESQIHLSLNLYKYVHCYGIFNEGMKLPLSEANSVATVHIKI